MAEGKSESEFKPLEPVNTSEGEGAKSQVQPAPEPQTPKPESQPQAQQPAPQPQPLPQGPPPAQQYYPPPPQPLFTSQGLQKLMGIGLLIGIIVLFVGAMLHAGGMYVKVDSNSAADLQRNLLASGNLVAGIGLFLIGLFLVLAMVQAKDLTDQQKTWLVVLLGATVVGFALVIL